MKTFEVKEVCKSCRGTGLYIGMAERDGAAVICHTCKGTGCHHFKYSYEKFIKRAEADNVKRVYQTNPGIMIGNGNNCSLEDFGGLAFEDWKKGVEFLSGTENRKYSCPSWWYQSADYKKKPNWNECCASLGSTFSKCPYFGRKEDCWNRWDKEFS